MKHAFVGELETFGSGGEMLDVIALNDGKLIVIMESRLAIYPDAQAFEAGTPHRIVEL